MFWSQVLCRNTNKAKQQWNSKCRRTKTLALWQLIYNLDNHDPYKKLLSTVFMKSKHFCHAFGLHPFFLKFFNLKRIGINTKTWVYRFPNPYNKIAINFLNYIILYYRIMMITNVKCWHMNLTNGLTRIMFCSMKELIY